MRRYWLGSLAVLVVGVAATTGLAQSDNESSAEKIRKILDQPLALDYTAKSLQDAVDHLKSKTGVNFVLDQPIFGPMGAIPPSPPEFGLSPAGGMKLKSERGKLRQSLQRFLSTYNLSYAILENSVLITSEGMVVTRQLGQRTNVNVDNVPVQKALKDLARSFALNLVVDPRVVESREVTLNLDNVTLETAMRLLAEVGGLKSVRMDNVLYVTTEANAEKLRREEPPTSPIRLPMSPYGYGISGLPGAAPGITVTPGPWFPPTDPRGLAPEAGPPPPNVPPVTPPAPPQPNFPPPLPGNPPPVPSPDGSRPPSRPPLPAPGNPPPNVPPVTPPAPPQPNFPPQPPGNHPPVPSPFGPRPAAPPVPAPGNPPPVPSPNVPPVPAPDSPSRPNTLPAPPIPAPPGSITPGR